MTAFLILTGASALNMALPGPGVLLTFTRSSCQGLGAGLGVSAGFLLSSLILAAAAVLIIAGLMRLPQGILESVRWIGIVVILWIALRLVLAAGAGASAVPAERHGGDLLAGFALGITSPYNLLFLLALLPQFAPVPLSALGAGALVAAYLLGQCLVLGAVSVLGAAVGRTAFGSTGAPVVQRLAGATLAGFALLAAAHPF